MTEADIPLRDQIARAVGLAMLWGHERFDDWPPADVRAFTTAAADAVLAAFDISPRDPR